MNQTRVLVTGAAGFIGHHLCRYLRRKDYWVRGVDYVPLARGWGDIDECYDEYWPTCDLRSFANAAEAIRGMTHVYALAADMGGMGFISANHWRIISNNARISLNTAQAVSTSVTIEGLFYTSSACIYPVQLQTNKEARMLREDDAWQGSPEDSYGVEKLMAEQLYLRMSKDAGIPVRIARFHNIYGPEGTWTGGREKLPAAACRKVAGIELSGNPEIEVWGDGEATRSFCYIDDCLEMIYRLMTGDYDQPMNIGTDHLVSVNEVFDVVAEIAGVKTVKIHDLSKPQGVRGRNADLTLMRKVLSYEPQTSLEEGLRRTYEWIYTQMGAERR